ncbi:MULTISPECIES: heavy metal translocating P-type ATPase [unclassified Mycolicibacterium]|uniref:heavy metal translocating P-type ATPase n=1 Tax=unclassified Mycolicibacterium TaxID=2636767 RepID=UPI0012DC85A7|nr:MULTISPECIES: heavy metal translocating P-type ATPase [unclassified Mycolicibacterium]MUL83172.1 heavy metal translocating P-type ATPase [Mycolicibacterium sp. CBMA 329]MUL89507.1 heavy metal translocating P-type ATPase [Mycolicibacterium sp. CBMA 331]MUM02736.1 heavy metal translocating P-type ATPase [Mycolicibacterium sp. CBMA 334]MUM39023.1 heavy metal translocating P-type ATPase [Mycolicibacterium sp. CBMA 247]MUM45571.1 heavy metal translocating P-type ATPase [Mycolicibacterium sp. CBM
MTTTEHAMHEHEHEHEHEHVGHAGHAGHGDHVAQFRGLFWVMAVLAVPTVALSPMFAMILGYAIPDVPGAQWISPVLGTVMYVWGGRPFLSGAISEIRSRAPGMMLLIGLAITVAFLSSWGASLGVLHHQLDFWWELALLIVIMLLGHWIEMRSLAQTTSALDSLAALLPDEAERVEGNGDAEQVVTVAPSDLRVGDLLIVRPGGSVPVDGRIVDGAADMDESMVTGESRSVRRGVGDDVVAGTVATDSGLRIRVTAVGEDTALAGIQRLVGEAMNSSSRAQRLADRAAGWLFWFALGSAVVTALMWTLLGAPDQAVVRTITVLVIACPHALGLAIPLVVSIATERAARGGVLIKDRLALETMRAVGAVLFDKTGTLTMGEPTVTAVTTTDRPEDELLALAAAAEADSEHPLARAIVAAARRRGLHVPAASDFSSSPAVGVSALVAGHRVQVGGPRLLEQAGKAALPDTARWNGAIVLHVLVGGHLAGALALADEIRPESRQAVDALHDLGIEVVMITGDAAPVASAVASELGIDRVFAGVRPEEKAAKVAELQGEGLAVAMVGDGVNDAPALAAADVGIAIGAGTDVAIASAGVILASSDPRSVLSVIELSRQSYRKMKQNLWWAAGYNLISVPLAAGVAAPLGVVMPMSVGAMLMSASTVVVALNAQSLRRLDLRPEARVAEPDLDGLGAAIVGDHLRSQRRR